MSDLDRLVQDEAPLLAALAGARDEQRELALKHEQMRQSPDYQASLLCLRHTIQGLLRTLQICDIAATRWHFFTENYLFPRHFDDVVEAAITAQLAIENGALNPARRELRYMLEVAVNTAFVDEHWASAKFNERIDFFKSKKVNKRNVDHITELPLRMLGKKREAFIQATRNAWVRSSNYVHLTKRRMDEKLSLRAKGIRLGFETAEMLAEVTLEVHHVCSIVVVLVFETIGPSFTGDILVDGIDSDENWPFHADEFLAVVDSHFDYKHERQKRLESHIERRVRRVRHHIPVEEPPNKVMEPDAKLPPN